MTDTRLRHAPDSLILKRPAGIYRRKLLFLLASLSIPGRGGQGLAATPAATPNTASNLPSVLIDGFPTEITATVAGPVDGGMDFWAAPVLMALGRTLPPGTRFRQVSVGAADGVTGANQFEARVAPDGGSLMLAPGAAALAWLAGDPRAQFDIGHWVPVMAGISSGVVVMRGGAAALTANRELRVATTSLIGSDLACLLAIELLGVRPVPVMLPAAQPGGMAGLHALAAGGVDAVLLRGRTATNLGALPEGIRPVFSLGAMDENGNRGRDGAFHDLPHLAELHTMLRGQPPGGALFDAWLAVTAAVQIEFAAVLPQLTPAAMVALWRRAGAEATQAAELRHAATDRAVRVVGGMAGTTALVAATANTATLLELRRWLGTRFNWHPS